MAKEKVLISAEKYARIEQRARLYKEENDCWLKILETCRNSGMIKSDGLSNLQAVLAYIADNAQQIKELQQVCTRNIEFIRANAALQRRVEELEARNAELEKIEARFVADAELGRLVRAMRPFTCLHHFHNKMSLSWQCADYNADDEEECKEFLMSATPEDALRAADVGKEAEPTFHSPE